MTIINRWQERIRNIVQLILLLAEYVCEVEDDREFHEFRGLKGIASELNLSPCTEILNPDARNKGENHKNEGEQQQQGNKFPQILQGKECCHSCQCNAQECIDCLISHKAKRIREEKIRPIIGSGKEHCKPESQKENKGKEKHHIGLILFSRQSVSCKAMVPPIEV